MWLGDTIFFNSDRDGHFNLYAYTVSNGRTSKVTNNQPWDVRWPSSDNENQIVYELNGELQVLDARTKKVRRFRSTFLMKETRGGRAVCPRGI
jgi:tricorn protease